VTTTPTDGANHLPPSEEAGSGDSPGGHRSGASRSGALLARAAAAVRRLLARQRPALWLELLFIVWLAWIYDDINNLSPLRTSVAYGNARSILNFERVLHLDPEAVLDHWLAGHRTLGWIVGNYYDNAHFVVTFGLIGVLWWWFPDRYRPLRNGLILTNLIAMVVFWLEPTAPPRLLDPSLYIDVVARSGSFGSWHSGSLATAANQLAAMPSLHLGWACWSAFALWRILPRTRWSWMVWLYPTLTAVAVMATGNHFLADVVAGVATFAIGQVAADRWQAWWTARQAALALRPGAAGDGRRAATVAATAGAAERAAGGQ
jgi:hypothetical protein